MGRKLVTLRRIVLLLLGAVCLVSLMAMVIDAPSRPNYADVDVPWIPDFLSHSEGKANAPWNPDIRLLFDTIRRKKSFVNFDSGKSNEMFAPIDRF
ncbi:unnamed protein product [Anisakis simplex]|uniref:Peptide ABC transporter permease n=1 Tax=Anisakis simplex TaxID=6269 RepID=A0A0M3KGW8_ANISI|nr:unnamed protein product [Anisakis simplex]